MSRSLALIALFFGLLTFAHSEGGNASWSPAALQWATDYNSRSEAFSDPYAITAWGAVHGRHVLDEKPVYQSLKIPLPSLMGRVLKGSLAIQTDSGHNEGRTIRSPLMIYNPGIFGGADDSLALRAIKNFRLRGYHVFVLPNSWNPDYVKALAPFNPGTLIEEAKVILAIAKTVKNRIGVANISSVSIAGESYGGFISLVAAALDSANTPSERLIDGTISAFGPPGHFGVASVNLDHGMDTTLDMYDHDCSSLLTRYGLYKNLYKAESQDELKAKTLHCMAPGISRNFQDMLFGTATTLSKYKHLGHIPDKSTAPTEYKKWRKDLRFGGFLNDFTPENLGDLTSERAGIAYWISHLPLDVRERVQIMTARDDFLNAGFDWTTIQGLLTPDQLIFLNSGGHIGYEELSTFQGFMDGAFNFLPSSPLILVGN